MNEYTAKDFKKGQPRWCPGCGDHFFFNHLTGLVKINNDIKLTNVTIKKIAL